MQPISAILNNLLSSVTCFFSNDVLPLSITTGKRKLSLSTADHKRKKMKVGANCDDFLVALPPEIRDLIIQKLDNVDYHRFSAVCKSWRSSAIATKQNPQFSLKQFPWLMLSSNSNFPDAHHGFFSLCHGKVFKLNLPEVRGGRCCGSSWGWLIMATGNGVNFLLNPFSRLKIQLPSQTTLPVIQVPHYLPKWWQEGPSFIRKAMLLSPPTIPCTAFSATDTEGMHSVAGNFLVVAIYANHKLCFCRPWDQAWTDFGNSHLQSNYEDIIFYRDQLYAIDSKYNLVLIEFGPHPRGRKLNMPCPEGHDLIFRYDREFIYLVESCGELLMVVRHWFIPPRRDGGIKLSLLPPGITTMFKVFKFDPEGPQWIKVDSLGDQMLFIGTSSCISLSASHASGFKGNCICFTDDNFSGIARITDGPQPCSDLGVFSLKDGTITSIFPTDSHSSLSPPIWFMPGPL